VSIESVEEIEAESQEVVKMKQNDFANVFNLGNPLLGSLY
jgi:hypothetical protein